MEAGLIAVAVTAALQALVLVVSSAVVPFLWWRVQKLERQLEDLDEVVSEVLAAAGVRKGGDHGQSRQS